MKEDNRKDNGCLICEAPIWRGSKMCRTCFRASGRQISPWTGKKRPEHSAFMKEYAKTQPIFSEEDRAKGRAKQAEMNKLKHSAKRRQQEAGYRWLRGKWVPARGYTATLGNLEKLHWLFGVDWVRGEAMSKVALERAARGEWHPGLGSRRSPEFRARTSEFVSTMQLNDPFWGWGKGKNKWGFFESKKGGDLPIRIPYQSSSELKYLEVLELKANVKSFGRCPFKVPYEYGIEKRNYIPDFKIELLDGTVIIAECKPEWRMWDPRVLEKSKACVTYCQEHGFKFVMLPAWSQRSSKPYENTVNQVIR